MKWAMLAALLAASAVRADPKSPLSISVGAGLAYDLLGLQVAYRSGHAEGYLAGGPLMAVLPGIAAGGRYYFDEIDSGPFMAINLAWHTGYIQTGDPGLNDYQPTAGHTMWATFTPGFRQTWGPLFLQAAFGFGVAWERTSYRSPANPIGPPPVPHRVGIIPDLMLGLGIRL